MMEQTFTPREDGHLEERERHVSITPEEKGREQFLIDRTERRQERRAFLLEHRRASLGPIRK